ncbi:tripartite tricarboxylate transporter substrate binding protein, partial [Corallococcus exiguus]|nr:tripartite tricarboxylate transporter substrate binding protein [Corallococcus exiguus]
LGTVAAKTADDAAFREVLAKANLGWAYADAAAFQKVIDKDRAFYAELVPRLGLQK